MSDEVDLTYELGRNIAEDPELEWEISYDGYLWYFENSRNMEVPQNLKMWWGDDTGFGESSNYIYITREINSIGEHYTASVEINDSQLVRKIIKYLNMDIFDFAKVAEEDIDAYDSGSQSFEHIDDPNDSDPNGYYDNKWYE